MKRDLMLSEKKFMELDKKILSDITVYTKYAKYLPELQRRETWEELVTRNMNMHISKYEEGNRFNHSETRERKLLLNKNEIKKLKVGTSQDGYNIVPLKMYIKNGRAKLLIGLAKGKKLYDKRAVIKERDLKREIKRV